MREEAVVRQRLTAGELLETPVAGKVMVQAACFAVEFACSRAVVFDWYAPFGVAAIVAALSGGTWGMVLGVLLGCLLPSGTLFSARYVAALLAVAAIRWTLNDLVKLRMHPFFIPLTSFAPILMAGLAMTLVSDTDIAGIAMYVAESMLAADVLYLPVGADTLLLKGIGLNAIRSQGLTCMTLSAGILILAFPSITLGGLSLGHVLAVPGILLAVRYDGATGGSIAGIGVSVVLSLSTAGVSHLSGVYTLGGSMADVFSPLGRLVSACTSVTSNAVASLRVGSHESALISLYEVMAASVIYMIWSKDVDNRLSAVFVRPADSLHSEGSRRSVIMRPDHAVQAFEGISDSVEEVSRRLDKFSASDINVVYSWVIDNTYVRCGLCVYCWERNYDRTIRIFGTLIQILRKSEKITKDDFPKQLTDHCSHTTEIVESINRQYTEFLTHEVTERRVTQIRGAAADQFGTTSQMLKSMAEELGLFERLNFTIAQCVNDVMAQNGITPIDVSCRVNRYDRMTIEAEAAQIDKPRLNRVDSTRQTSQVCGCTSEMPCISLTQGKCRMQVSERSTYRVQSGSFQHVSRNGQLCSGNQELFPDRNGRQIAIINDGMGTGGRAVVDGTMVAGIMTKLIKTGIGFDRALKIVDSAPLVKPGDESLITLDVAIIDLFNGKAELMKAGTTVGVLRRDGRAAIIDTPLLPVEILTEVKLIKETVRLSSGDLLVLFSDGVVASGDGQVREMVTEREGTIPQELAERIVSQAIKRRSDGHDDDITMLVLSLSELKKELWSVPLLWECAYT